MRLHPRDKHRITRTKDTLSFLMVPLPILRYPVDLTMNRSWSRRRKKKLLMVEVIFSVTRQSPSDVSGYSVLRYLRVRYAAVYIYSKAGRVVSTLSHTVVTTTQRNRLFLVNSMVQLNVKPSAIGNAVFIWEDAARISQRIISRICDISFPTFAIYLQSTEMSYAYTQPL